MPRTSEVVFPSRSIYGMVQFPVTLKGYVIIPHLISWKWYKIGP